jgi:DNA invertase Pin-like site-specific DNA recombinase
MATIGYARVSTSSQDLDAQTDALVGAGCSEVFGEKISSRAAEIDREQLQSCLAALKAGDELVVAKLDRLGRTQVEVIARLHQLQSDGIHVRTLDGLINTRALGKMAPLVIGLLTGLAEVERELIRERTQESIDYRRATGGDLGGRRRSYNDAQAALVRRLRNEGNSFRAIARQTGISVAACHRIINGG